MNWKDYFSFDRRDRTAIILLLLILVLVLVLVAVSDKEKNTVSPEKEAAYRTRFDSLQGSQPEKPVFDSYPTKLREGETIEINTADTTLLKQIPGIGSSYSRRIVNYRNSLGGYVRIEQLREVWGLDEDLYQRIKPYITLEGNPKRIRINSLPEQELRKHPYISYKQAKVIADIRQRKGKIASVNRLSLLEEFTEEDIVRLKPYLSFE
ncbi:helix-hairpin-helix domain-containing protein [Dysgonomonas sp. 25]|uniref:helix-hairpin-helix domain-containing protein n=1 Tax=Dysgonomonas sp. 25 TaxID=2302933 RepID=UPI0013D47755|nr:helix-hairpin-helix domain-containing protein [Dysgonomonas sp. 25]NDV70055.1 helix-hairpin-helix domain-containing protein [Dysgonomonas sp. 25]